MDGYLLFFILTMIVMKFNHDDGDHDHSIHLNKFECLNRIESCLGLILNGYIVNGELIYLK